MDEQEENLSAPVRFVGIVWDHANEVKPHSWNVLNAALHSALRTAIVSCMRFGKDDFIEINKRYRFARWAGVNGEMWGEGYYSEAVEADNRSACIAFEKLKERKPFMLDGKRLAVGVRFNWWEKWPKVPANVDPERWMRFGQGAIPLRVTSITPEAIIGCFYEPGGHESTVLRRIKITQDDLKKQNAAIKGYRDAHKAVIAAAEAQKAA